MLSRGLRNNNPGNIRRSASAFRGEVVPGDDAEFKQFETMAWGFRAMYLIIYNYRELYGINTLERIIRRWAPPTENDTAHYINTVARRMGRSPRSVVDSSNGATMMAMVTAMAHIECGVAPDAADVEEGWRLFGSGCC